jgi:hypothetical protein
MVDLRPGAAFHAYATFTIGTLFTPVATEPTSRSR